MKQIEEVRDKMLFYYKRLTQVEKALETGCNKASIKIEHPEIHLNIMCGTITPEIEVVCRQILIEKQKEFKSMYDQFSQEYCELLLAQNDGEEN